MDCQAEILYAGIKPFRVQSFILSLLQTQALSLLYIPNVRIEFSVNPPGFKHCSLMIMSRKDQRRQYSSFISVVFGLICKDRGSWAAF